MNSASLAILLLSQVSLVFCEQHILRSAPQLRNASLSDASEIAIVFNAAFDPLPWCKYVYDLRPENHAEHQRCTELSVVQRMNQSNTYAQVIDAASRTISSLSIVAAALWVRIDGATEMEARFTPKRCMHKDLNVTRALDWQNKFDKAKKKHIDGYFGPRQLYLDQIGTHPDYQLHGAGTRLVEDGIEVAKREGRNLTLIAQPTAEGFYLHVGFRSLGKIIIPSVDNDLEFEYIVMAYDFDDGTFMR